jgi:hypothetical protein
MLKYRDTSAILLVREDNTSDYYYLYARRIDRVRKYILVEVKRFYMR